MSKEKIIRARAPINPDEQADARFRLTNILQTSLDLTAVLELFMQHIQDSVPVTGINYSHPAQKIEIQLGKQCVHRCDYRLITQKDNLGEISFSRSKRFSEAEMGQLEMLLGVLIFPLRNALQYREALQTALRDPLTGAGNRVALESTLQREQQMAQRYKHELSLLMIDIDHFKSINDNYGHSAGDEVLREVVQAIQSVTRQTDITFRYGGEEFVVVLSRTSNQGAQIIAERIRHFIETLKVEFNKEQICTSISIGVSSLENGETTKVLFERADKALYQAKARGRNQVIPCCESDDTECLQA